MPSHVWNRPESFDQLRAQSFEGFFRDGSLGSRNGMNRGHNVVAGGGRAFDETGGFGVADRPITRELLSDPSLGGSEIRQALSARS